MGSLTLTMLIVIVIGFICILITPKAPADTAAPWECQTCGAGNPSNSPQCSQCGMDK